MRFAFARPPFLATAFIIALGGCHAGAGAAATAATPGPGAFTVVTRAETGPITALAVKAPFVWAAGATGLRRWNLTTGDYESVGATMTDPHPVTALAVDDEGSMWVARAGQHDDQHGDQHGYEVGRWRDGATGGLRYEPNGAPGAIAVIAAGRPVATQGVWAGGRDGLFHGDARGWTPVPELQGMPVTALAVDDDGRSVWAGVPARGLYRVGADGHAVAAGGAGGEGIVLDDIAGIAKSASGTWLVAGNVGGQARLYALTLASAAGFAAATPGVRAVALVQREADALLVAGPAGHEEAYALKPHLPGEATPPGGSTAAGALRFSPLRRDRTDRWIALATGMALPPAPTVAAAAGTELYCGTARMGVARAAAGEPTYLQGSELVGDAERLFVACTAPGRCFVVTDGPRAWLTDGDRYVKSSVGEPPSAEVLALASDGQGASYAVAYEPQPPTLVITKHVAPASSSAVAGAQLGSPQRSPSREGSGTPSGFLSTDDEWPVFHRVPIDLPPRTRPRATFAAVSPAGALWVGLRAAPEAGGDDMGWGAIEIDLGNGHSVQHRPRRAGEPTPPEALPLAADLTAILFDRDATWYASLAGVSRWQEGQLRSWGENDGLSGERVRDIARAANSIVAATSEGLSRFDGQAWRPVGSATLAARGLADDPAAGALWVATNKGLRWLSHSGGSLGDPAAAPVVVAGDVHDVALDAFGRVWALTSSYIAAVLPPNLVAHE